MKDFSYLWLLQFNMTDKKILYNFLFGNLFCKLTKVIMFLIEKCSSNLKISCSALNPIDKLQVVELYLKNSIKADCQ